MVVILDRKLRNEIEREVKGSKRVIWKCPRCELFIDDYPAISRRDNKTEICSRCGEEEALFDFKISQIISKERRWLK